MTAPLAQPAISSAATKISGSSSASGESDDAALAAFRRIGRQRVDLAASHAATLKCRSEGFGDGVGRRTGSAS